MVVVKNKKGFIKYALRYGYRVHPVYTFGECDTYWTFNKFRRLRTELNKHKIPTVFFWGAPFFPLLPRPDIEIATYVGGAIQFPQLGDAELTSEVVDEWHRKYISALQDLFEKRKAEAGKPRAKHIIK